MNQEQPLGRSRVGGSSSELRRILPLLGVLAAVYALMVGLSAMDLSAVDWGEHFWNISQWRLKGPLWRAPIFLVSQGEDGTAINWLNQRQILEQGAINIILGVGMTFVILTAGIDLSVGSLLAFCNVLFVVTAKAVAGKEAPGLPAFVTATFVCLLGGVFCGWVNGAVTVWGRVQSFIVTLGMFLAARGLAYVISGKEPQRLVCSGAIRTLLPIGLAIGSVAVAYVVLGYTRLGRYMYAVGGNLEASRLSGVPVAQVRIFAFVISGFCAALAGIVFWARLSTGTYLAGESLELYAIAAVVIGGTSLVGGEGSVLGTLLGALIMAVLYKGLNTVGVDEMTQRIIIGSVIVAAALYDSMRHRRAEG
jgi:ribose/xylose/arabinose/galactoside ABC-type transport system permease subunit